MTTETQVREPDAPAATMLVDCDVHEMPLSTDVFLPYLKPEWQRVATQHLWVQKTLTGAYPFAAPLSNLASARAEWVLEDMTAGTTVEGMREHLLEGEGVSIAILNGLYHVAAAQGYYEFYEALASAYNDWQIEHWLDKEPRLRGSVHIVPHDPQVAAREIDRVAAHPQIVQVFLPLTTATLYGDPIYRPILEATVRNDLALTFHHGVNTTSLASGYPRYWTEWHMLAIPQSAQAQIVSLVLNGAFDRYPDLNVFVLETGVAWLPWFLWRLDEQYKQFRAEVPWVKRLPSQHIRDHVRVSTQPMSDISAKQFVQLVDMAESERIFVFSTDYPHYDADSADTVLAKSLPEALRQRVRYQNALESYPRLRGLLT